MKEDEVEEVDEVSSFDSLLLNNNNESPLRNDCGDGSQRMFSGEQQKEEPSWRKTMTLTRKTRLNGETEI